MKIGIMDSGAGGLTILNAIRQKFPALDLLYLADEEFAPYGEKTPADIQGRIIKIAQFFDAEQVDAIVVACNTATVCAIDQLRAVTALPVIGVEPAVKPAFRMSKKRHVAVLATPLTAASERLGELIERWREDSRVQIMSSASLAYAIDDWPTSKVQVEATVRTLCAEMIQSDVDTLVLACTHYPLVKELFTDALGAQCEIIEPSEGVTAQLMRRLEQAYPEVLPAWLGEVRGSIEIVSSKGLENMPNLIGWVEDSAALLVPKSVAISDYNAVIGA
ncbi:glutamate racemase [Marinomonas pollencensis]|uniref:Glutamate racemase n=1 Tax=Marinomonas pollencensis TaxID=491954 RepID=A0A3E0DRJ8_9GAMM|nr:glutamate racemase [Marinomonas pollencensis]REG85765.1 glutamate racemase [Marinomonas pollencensis]